MKPLLLTQPLLAQLCITTYILLSHSADALLLASAYIFDDEGRYSHFVFVLIVELMHVEQLIKPPKKHYMQ